MEFREYYLSLTEDQREAYAERAGTTIGYMPQLIAVPPFKTPKPDLMRRLAEASEGNVTLPEVLDHFYGAKSASKSSRRNNAA